MGYVLPCMLMCCVVNISGIACELESVAHAAHYRDYDKYRATLQSILYFVRALDVPTVSAFTTPVSVKEWLQERLKVSAS